MAYATDARTLARLSYDNHNVNMRKWAGGRGHKPQGPLTVNEETENELLSFGQSWNVLHTTLSFAEPGLQDVLLSGND